MEIAGMTLAPRQPAALRRRAVPRSRTADDFDATLPTALMDGAARQRYALGVQRTAGNRAMSHVAHRNVQRQGPAPSEWDIAPNPYAVTTPGGGAQSELAANPYATEQEPVTLSNPRFVGEPRLERIAKGEGALSPRDNGRPVKAVQQALIDLGFELVQHERDGDYGSETQTAISLFRSRRSIPGDKLSARALGELDRTAPRPGKAEEHYFDYERLFADGYLDVTLAVGFDENGAHKQMLTEARTWLADRGFKAMPPETGKPEEFRLRRDLTYPTRAGDRTTREVIVRINLIPPGPGAAGQYGRGLSDSEISIYNGHARRGIGPDFDEDKSAKENFVIGIASALHAAGRAVEPKKIEQSHYVVNRKNDLEQMTLSGAFDKEKYRVWLFEACTTIAYFDELRGGILPEGVDRANLDLMGTRLPAPLITEMASSLAMLDGIIGARTIEQITAAMDKAGEDLAKALTDISETDRQAIIKMTRNLNVHEGAGDNPIARPGSP
jgi:peptidoglycan hydrolase-like protein with peptidoglycan-binding domain